MHQQIQIQQVHRKSVHSRINSLNPGKDLLP